MRKDYDLVRRQISAEIEQDPYPPSSTRGTDAWYLSEVLTRIEQRLDLIESRLDSLLK